jgi:hypothetical protein
MWLTGDANIEHTEKVELGDRWNTCITMEGDNPLLTYRALGFRKGGERGLNTPTCEVTSCK